MRDLSRVDVDHTELVDSQLPFSWICPNCRQRNITDKCANDILLEYLKVMRHCKRCGHVHLWILKLTAKFKERVVDCLINGGMRKRGR